MVDKKQKAADVLVTSADIARHLGLPMRSIGDRHVEFVEVPSNTEEKERGIIITPTEGRGLGSKYHVLFPEGDLYQDALWNPPVKRSHPFARFKGK
jgi:hypothetical protein